MVQTLSASLVKKMIPPRPADSNKGKNGHVLVIAGSRGMSGAAYLVALSALRSGAGLVTVAMPESERAVVTHQLPEALTLPLPETLDGAISEHALSTLETYLKKRTITSLAVGPGLSERPSVQRVIKGILKNWDQPLVLDADGLNTITAADCAGYPQLIITPHPAELARLLGIERDAVQKERLHVAEQVARDYQLLCVLKGSKTVVTDGKTTRLNPTGNPAMATAGTGDVLTGVIAGLLAQGLSSLEAACSGVYLHGLAGDLARVSDRGLLASDVAQSMPRAFSKIGVKS